jgi:hypothetical protein
MISCDSLDIHQRGVQLGERLAPTLLAGVGIEAGQGGVPEPPVALDPVGRVAQRGGLEAAPAPLARPLREMSAARSSTFRCRDTAGIEMERGAVSS